MGHRIRANARKKARVGGGVWKSNPPFDPRRTESPALKAGKVTGPLSPPGKYRGEAAGVKMRRRCAGNEGMAARIRHLFASSRPARPAECGSERRRVRGERSLCRF